MLLQVHLIVTVTYMYNKMLCVRRNAAYINISIYYNHNASAQLVSFLDVHHDG